MRRLREGVALGLAALACGLFRLALLPLYPVCLLVGRMDGMRGRRR